MKKVMVKCSCDENKMMTVTVGDHYGMVTGKQPCDKCDKKGYVVRELTSESLRQIRIVVDECILKGWRYCNSNAGEPCGYDALTHAEKNSVQTGVSFMRDKCLEITEKEFDKASKDT